MCTFKLMLLLSFTVTAHKEIWLKKNPTFQNPVLNLDFHIYEDGPMAATMRTNLSKLRPTNIFHTRTPVQDFNSFSIMFYTTLLSSTIYQKIGDIFYSLIFLEFRTVWIHHIVITIRARTMDTHFIETPNFWAWEDNLGKITFGAFVVFLANLIAPIWYC
jgi:hypothetical protein